MVPLHLHQEVLLWNPWSLPCAPKRGVMVPYYQDPGKWLECVAGGIMSLASGFPRAREPAMHPRQGKEGTCNQITKALAPGRQVLAEG